MKLLKIIHNYYYLLIVAGLMFILNFRGCKDLEDCRSIYTNKVWVEFKGKDNIAIDTIKFEEPIGKIIYTKTTVYQGTSINPLENLKDKTLSFSLDPKQSMTSFLFYRSSAGPSSEPDTLTIFYKRIPSLLSPCCGVQEEYIIENVKTTFAGCKVIKPLLRSKDYEKYNSAEENKPNVEIHY